MTLSVGVPAGLEAFSRSLSSVDPTLFVAGGVADPTALSWVVAVVLGVVQGVLEWVPVSSEGAVALALAVLGAEPAAATRLALALHLGTAVAATAYYRSTVGTLLGQVPAWRPGRAFEATFADLSFVVVAMAASGVTGGLTAVVLEDLVTALSGGAFAAAIGLLLVGTGAIQWLAGEGTPRRGTPGALDAVLVGAVQGLALLPGVSRSGTTVSVLLLRGYDADRSLELSFLLSIPAALVAGVLASGTGVLGVSPAVLALALSISALVGFLSIGTLVAVVRRVAFWRVCVGFGALAVLGGVLAVAI